MPGRLRNGTIVDGTYEIVGEVGRGMMGVVYEAYDRRLRRNVALKRASTPKYGAFLRAEAVALAAVNHPGLVSVYAAGEHEGHDYLVIELLRGVSLQDRLDDRRRSDEAFSAEEIVAIGSALASALAAVHDAGLTHRDVKPANVILCAKERVVLMDLGLSRPEYTVASNKRVSGTPAYVAPEIVTGAMRPGEGPKADVYSLGVLLFALATLRVPFETTSATEAFDMHVNAPVPEVERDDLPPALVSAIRAALAKDPDERPDGARVFGRMLESSLERRTRTERVLVVDDDDDVAHLLSSMLKSAAPSVSIETAHDAEAALRAFRRASPTLMFLDLELPRTNGIELLLMLRERRQLEGCSVIAMSARARDADVTLLAELGVPRFIRKDGALVRNVRSAVREAFAR